MKTRGIDGLIALFSLMIFIIAFGYKIGFERIILCGISIGVFVFFIVKFFGCEKTNIAPKSDVKMDIISENITELVLLNDIDEPIGHWEMYGKISLVIGIDTGENNVNVNLMNTIYASMIEKEHAVLNYSSGKWYIEDLASQNGVALIKSDGKKYKLTSLKPCLVEKGDIIFIGLTRLKLF